ncbi:uncharacterized protein LOC144880217 [Branchiostoma floridae x Branchiostoma japonicum]
MGVLQGNSVQFVPGLPDWKREAISRVRVVLYTKIYLKFPSKFWDDEEEIWYAGERRGYYTVWQNMEAPGLFPSGSHIILVTVIGEEARRVEAQSDQATQAEVMAAVCSTHHVRSRHSRPYRHPGAEMGTGPVRSSAAATPTGESASMMRSCTNCRLLSPGVFSSQETGRGRTTAYYRVPSSKERG